MMTTDEEMFNSKTKDGPEDEVFNSNTRDHPHKITLCYSLDLPSTIVQKFPSLTIRKHTGDRVWFARAPQADVCLFDRDFSRNCMELKCGTGENGEMIVTVKNLDDKKFIELKIPGRDKISLAKDQESRIETQTLLTISLMPLIVIFQNGDVDSSSYEVIMNGLVSQAFNTLMLSTSGNRTSGPPPIPVLHYQTNGAASSSYYPPLPACPDLSQSWPTNSFSSQTRPKQIYEPDSTQFSRNPNTCTSNLRQVDPPYGLYYNADINPSAHPCSCGFGISQGNIITNPESCRCGSQSFIDLHRRETERQTSCPVCNPSIVPYNYTQGGPYYSQSNQQGIHQPLQRCSSDSLRMPTTPINNWHNHRSPGGLPTAAPIRDNFVNTHPYTENTPHDFNVNIIDMYKR
ncbi:hypothetical protein LOTGIDRAFT_231699 [Lottia gigantea]|uniref:Uncharacterized protein n=1 Tax=Lottia gigantea TaxID=225164 RepID=V4AQ36_LOTGI|nr:hypothetical protein LOTGIDRAFT_231699 [Lottia gigantea]ESO96895.1 hypothetical protein LOTGIDRAFT_231699 [Lottia gigantea]